jgi:alpha-methylacyl-CoA racemase
MPGRVRVRVGSTPATLALTGGAQGTPVPVTTGAASGWRTDIVAGPHEATTPVALTGGPLAGVRVVELAALGAAPYGVMLLADLGADVIRVDRPGAGSDPATLAHSGVWRNRRSIALDLKHPDARTVLGPLLASADVLVEGLRPGTMERLGLGPDVVLAAHPRLVYARMTGWGQAGPLAATAGHDLNYAALSGALHTVGAEGTAPPPVANYLADNGGGGTFLAIGVLAALLERERSGQGQVIDVAMLDGAASLTSFVRGLAALGAWTDRRGTNLLDGGAPFYATYRCADGRWVAVGAIEPQFFAALIEGIGLDIDPGSQHDVARWPELRAAIAARFATRSRDEWAELLGTSDACVTPVLALDEVQRHPHNRARGTFGDELDGAVPDTARGHAMPSPAPRLSRTPGSVRFPAPVPGADARAILSELGIPPEVVDRLIGGGAVGDAS